MKLIDDQGDVSPKIGLESFAADVVLGDTRVEKPRNRDRRLILLPGETDRTACSVKEEEVEAPKLVDASGEEVSSLTWDSYLAWRKTKCRPFNREQFAARVADAIGNASRDYAKDRILEEIDQATHEFVGEVAELGELFLEHGPTVFFGEKRTKLIDEIGDIFFCGAWALDAWGTNPLYGAADLEMLRVPEGHELTMYAHIIAGNDEQVVLSDPNFMSILGSTIMKLMLGAQTNAGLLCNSFKKLRFQRREQKVDVQVSRIANVLFAVNQILVIANSSVEESLLSNQKKLDARFPEGYKPGVGGGIRTGEGQ